MSCITYKCMDTVHKIILLYINGVSGLCLCLRDVAMDFNLSFNMCRWLVEGEDVECVHRGTGQAPPAFDQQAFVEVVRIAVAAIAQTCAVVNQGGSNDLQRLEAPHPSLGKEGEVDVMRGIQDRDVGTKRKEDPSSSNPGNKQKTSVSQGYPGWG